MPSTELDKRGSLCHYFALWILLAENCQYTLTIGLSKTSNLQGRGERLPNRRIDGRIELQPCGKVTRDGSRRPRPASFSGSGAEGRREGLDL